MTDTERIEAIMTDQHLNNVAFCNKVGMNQATLSNILGHRTNPSLQVLRSIVEAFPQLNPMWVLMGEGLMKKPTAGDDDELLEEYTPTPDDMFGKGQSQSPEFAFQQLPQSSGTKSVSSQNGNSGNGKQVEAYAAMPAINVNDIVTGVVSKLQKPTRKIIEVRIFFDDGTFETFSSK